MCEQMPNRLTDSGARDCGMEAPQNLPSCRRNR